MTYTIATSNDAPLWTSPKIVVFPKFHSVKVSLQFSEPLPKVSMFTMVILQAFFNHYIVIFVKDGEILYFSSYLKVPTFIIQVAYTVAY